MAGAAVAGTTGAVAGVSVGAVVDTWVGACVVIVGGSVLGGSVHRGGAVVLGKSMEDEDSPELEALALLLAVTTFSVNRTGDEKFTVVTPRATSDGSGV